MTKSTDTLTTRFRLRLCIRIAPQFTDMPDVLRTVLNGIEVVITSKDGRAPCGTDWIVLRAVGFPSKASAQEFGTRLKMIVQLAGIYAGPGVDTGKDNATSCVSDDFLREMGLLQPRHTVVPDIHGLCVFPDDGNKMMAYTGQARVRVESNPTPFMNALRYLSDQDTRETDISLATATRLLNHVRMSQHPLVRFILSIVAVEPLGRSLTWSTTEKTYLKRIVKAVRDDSDLDRGSKERICYAVRNSLSRGPTGLKQGVVRRLACLGRHDLQDEWKELYDERSALVHGRKDYDVDEVVRLADRASILARTLVLAALNEQGIRPPSHTDLSRGDYIIGMSRARKCASSE